MLANSKEVQDGSDRAVTKGASKLRIEVAAHACTSNQTGREEEQYERLLLLFFVSCCHRNGKSSRPRYIKRALFFQCSLCGTYPWKQVFMNGTDEEES